jgi:hypothetical protein
MPARLVLLSLLLSLLLLPGCVRSLHPIYTQETLIYDPALLGTWVDEEGETRLEIAASSDNDQPDAIKSYRVLHTDTDGKSARLLGHLAKVGDMLVADLTIADENKLPDSDFARSHLFPLHTFWIITRDAAGDPKAFTVRAIDHDWMTRFAAENPAAVGHYKTNEDVILTAPPAELQKFLIAHAKDPGMLTDAERFRRTNDAAPVTAPATSPAASRPAKSKQPQMNADERR